MTYGFLKGTFTRDKDGEKETREIAGYLVFREDQKPIFRPVSTLFADFELKDLDSLRISSSDLQWEPIESSNLSQAAWHEKIGLALRFHNGGEYIYPDVTAQTFQDLLKAESKGKFFHANIRPEENCLKIR